METSAWTLLLRSFVRREINERAFHDRFFQEWHRLSATNFSEPLPPSIERLFFVVEAYCPDPELRDPDSLYEADEAELRQAAAEALVALVARAGRGLVPR